MRVFWIALAVFTAAAAALLAARFTPPAPKTAPDLGALSPPPTAASPSPTPPPEPPPSTTAAPDPQPPPLDPAHTPANATDPTPPPTIDPRGRFSPLPSPSSEPASVDPPPSPSPAPAPPPPPKPAAPSPSPPPAAAEPDPAPAAPPNTAVQHQADGSTLVEDRFVIKGEGTPAKPYEITWDFLISAEETYQPRLGRKKLPDRLSLVNNKRIRITGYIAFPLMAKEPTEVLAMLNQWDGCCIGVPPSPYDAVEVRLAQPASQDQRMMIFGSVEGKLVVDPYLVKDWLVSLYTMEDAVLMPAQE